MKCHVGFFLIYLMLFSLQAALLDSSGNAYREIVIAENAPDTVKLAAKEFQYFSYKLCNADLKIVTQSTGRPVIYIGNSPALEAEGLISRQLSEEGYAIQTGQGFLALYGRDYSGKPLLGPVNPWRSVEAYNPKLKLGAFGEAGTLTSVYEFFQHVGKVRFYMPGELGTVICPVKDLKVPELRLSGSPKVSYRYPWFSMFENSPESALWARRIGFGGKAPVIIIHSYDQFRRYKDTHPEYFALVDGKRAFTTECVADGKGHLCLTNPAVIRQWADDITAYFKANPEVDIYPLAPNDGLTRICECSNCRKELRENAPDQGVFSYHIWNFTQKVASLVGKKFPKKYVGCLAYGKYRIPPEEIEAMPNVAVMFCNYRSSLANPEEAKQLHSEINAWSRKVDRIYLWSWYLDHWLPWTGLPVVFSDTIAKELRWLLKNPKYSGEFIESENPPGGSGGLAHYNVMMTPGMQHWNLYLTARLYWNPDQNIDYMFNEYCTLFYGPASKLMKQFWKDAEKRRNEFYRKNKKCFPDILFTTQFIMHLKNLLMQAEKTVIPDSVYARRINLIKKEFERGASRLIRMESAGNREMTLARLKNGFRSLSSISPVKFTGKSGEVFVPPTWMYAGYDRQFLYFKFLCFEPEMQRLKCKVKEKDNGNIWTDDSIELFLCPDESRRNDCYHIIANTSGTLFDAKVLSAAHGDVKWESLAEVKSIRQMNRWILEIKIPFVEIGINDPFFTGTLAANFYRNRLGQEAQTSCWSPIGTFAHYTPEKFGTIRLK